MSQINADALAFRSVNGQKVPAEGPRAIPIPLDFSIVPEYDLDLQGLISRNFISMIQAIYLDNSGNAASMSVYFPNTNQTVTIAPNRQGYRSVLCPNPAKMSFLSQGGVLVNVELLNYPVTNSDWPCITGA